MSDSRPEPRIAPLEAPFAPEIGALLGALTPPDAPQPPGLLRVLVKHPQLLERMMATGSHFTGPGSTLAIRDREIVVARTSARCGCDHEWGMHVARFAAAAGFDEATIRRTVAHPPDPEAWAPNEFALIAMVDGLHARSTLDDDAWASLARHYDETQIIEAVALCGWYRMLSSLRNALHVPPEPGHPRLPRAL